MGRKEFVALIAMMLASVAFSIDAMLPALPQIGAELSPSRPENAPLILTTFLLGMGIGTFFTGPLSDAYGRKRVVTVFAGLFIAGSAFAWAAGSLEMVLAARMLQGLGAAGPRVIALAIVRDRFAGRQMAQIVSVVMMIFTLVPAVAPLMGAYIIDAMGWRGIFAAFILFASTFCIWMIVRLPETLPPEKRRPLKMALLVNAVIEIAAHPVARAAIIVQMLVAAMLFATLMLMQPIYDLVYDRGDEFPFWVFFIALIAGGTSLLNAVLVVRFGMQQLITFALGAQIIISTTFLVFDLGTGPNGFYFFAIWQTFIFCQAALTTGNLNAMGMEPMGHIAGMAASVMGALSTVGAVLISGPIGAMFDGTETTLIACALVLAVLSFGTMVALNRRTRAQA